MRARRPVRGSVTCHPQSHDPSAQTARLIQEQHQGVRRPPAAINTTARIRELQEPTLALRRPTMNSFRCTNLQAVVRDLLELLTGDGVADTNRVEQRGLSSRSGRWQPALKRATSPQPFAMPAGLAACGSDHRLPCCHAKFDHNKRVVLHRASQRAQREHHTGRVRH
jgi:hypothetical protein